MKKFANILLIMISCASIINAQETRFLNRADRNQQIPARNIFHDIEQAMEDGNVSGVSRFFGPQTYFSLTNGSNGYYSSNQAFYILENFFKIYRVKGFRFNNIQPGDNSPYATGVYTYELKGRRDTAQVYISLKQSGSSWIITQITIN